MAAAAAGGQEATPIDIDRIARAIDPRKMGPRGLLQLVETVDLLSRAEAGVELAGVRTPTLVSLLAKATDAQLNAVAAAPAARALVLDEVFRRMSEHLRADRAATTRGVVRWRIACGGEYQRFQTVVADGACITGSELDRTPRVTLTLSMADFLRMAVGDVGVTRLLAARRLRLRGDLRFALRLAGLFDIPKS